MPNARRIHSALPAVLAILGAACSDDSTGPGGRSVQPGQIVAQCSRGTIGDATTTQTHTGAVNGEDCQVIDDPDEGRLEGYVLTQAAFGSESELLVDLDAEFDGVIAILAPNGDILWWEDNDGGGTDFGNEEYVLSFDLDPEERDYFIAVYAYNGEAGDYTLRVGPVP